MIYELNKILLFSNGFVSYFVVMYHFKHEKLIISSIGFGMVNKFAYYPLHISHLILEDFEKIFRNVF